MNKKEFLNKIIEIKEKADKQQGIIQNLFIELLNTRDTFTNDNIDILDDICNLEEFFNDITDETSIKNRIENYINNRQNGCWLQDVKNMTSDINPSNDYFIDDGYGWPRDITFDDISNIIDEIIKDYINN